MKYFLCFAALLWAVGTETFVHAHGVPLTVHVDGGKLAVSQVPEPTEYPPYVFVQEGEVGEPFPPLEPGPLGEVIVWDVPGFEITGMDNQSSLSIEVLPRDVLGASPAEQRILWYWDSATELVEPAPATQAFYLLGTDMRYATLAPPDSPEPPAFLLASTMTDQQGFHNHGLLSYALGNSPAAEVGVYGFFARLTASLYDPSDPFLLIFNDGVDDSQLIPAALAINAAAVDPLLLTGDYNDDGTVDAADYVVLRQAAALGSTSLPNRDPAISGPVDDGDFLAWRDHFGQVEGGGAGSVPQVGSPTGASRSPNPVPEPAAWWLAACGATMLPVARRWRCGPRSRRVRA